MELHTHINWRGRGYIAGLAILLAVGFLAVGAAFGDNAALLFFGIGWFVGGLTCFIFGRRWNRLADVHRFCELRLQTWGPIYMAIGVFLIQTAIWLAWLQQPFKSHRH